LRSWINLRFSVALIGAVGGRAIPIDIDGIIFIGVGTWSDINTESERFVSTPSSQIGGSKAASDNEQQSSISKACNRLSEAGIKVNIASLLK
jgi:hypothetical protein